MTIIVECLMNSSSATLLNMISHILLMMNSRGINHDQSYEQEEVPKAPHFTVLRNYHIKKQTAPKLWIFSIILDDRANNKQMGGKKESKQI